MKTLQSTLLLFICLSFCHFNFAQNKSVALKFDEFSEASFKSYSPEKLSLNARVIRFAQEILKEKDSKAYIIFYNQRKGKFPLNKGEEWNKLALEILTGDPYDWRNPKYKVPLENVISINGGYREDAALELWIVLPDAEFPKPKPVFERNEIAICPEINVSSDGFRHDRNLPLNFSVIIKGEEPNSNLNLEWNVTAGKIISGQGTNQIKIDLSETNARHITASVQVKGLNSECDNHSFYTTEVGLYPYKVDEFYYAPYSEIAARMDALFRYVYFDPTVTGYIIIYGRREGDSREVAKTIYTLRQAMEYQKLDKSKVKIVEGGFRESGMIEFYILPPGVEPPEPTPTLDKKFVVLKKIVKRK